MRRLTSSRQIGGGETFLRPAVLPLSPKVERHCLLAEKVLADEALLLADLERRDLGQRQEHIGALLRPGAARRICRAPGRWPRRDSQACLAPRRRAP